MKLMDFPRPFLRTQNGPENGFLIKGTNDDGEVVRIQAVRYDDLTGTNLACECKNLPSFHFIEKLALKKLNGAKHTHLLPNK